MTTIVVDPNVDPNVVDGAVESDDVDAFFESRLVECLRCGEVYRKVAPARYVRDGDDGNEKTRKTVGRPCVECGTRDECIEWRGTKTTKTTNATKTTKTTNATSQFRFREGLVWRRAETRAF